MYPHQRERLTRVLERDGLAALVATAAANLAYVAAEELAPASTPRLLVVTPTATALVAHARDTATLDADHVIAYDTTPADALGAALDALGVAGGAVGLDTVGLSAAEAAAVTAALAPRTIRPGEAAWRAARAVKSPFEIDCLERGLLVLEEALNALVQVLAPGMTPKEAATVCETHVATHGMALDRVLIASGADSRAFRAGDRVRMELAGRWKGYHAVVARAAVLGTPTAAQDDAHAAIEAPLAAALGALRPGTPARAVHAAFARAARASATPEAVGHGIGLEPEEAPRLTAASDEPLEVDVVIALTSDGGAGAGRLVDTVLLTARGIRRLNRTQPGLVTLD